MTSFWGHNSAQHTACPHSSERPLGSAGFSLPEAGWPRERLDVWHTCPCRPLAERLALPMRQGSLWGTAATSPTVAGWEGSDRVGQNTRRLWEPVSGRTPASAPPAGPGPVACPAASAALGAPVPPDAVPGPEPLGAASAVGRATGITLALRVSWGLGCPAGGAPRLLPRIQGLEGGRLGGQRSEPRPQLQRAGPVAQGLLALTQGFFQESPL